MPSSHPPHDTRTGQLEPAASRDNWINEGISAEDLAPSLRRVLRGQLCSGCGACEAITSGKVAMANVAPGFLRPIQFTPISASEDEEISRVCPGLGQVVDSTGRVADVLWGPYVSMWTGWATDAEIRFAGSSGGALTAIALHLLVSGRVDAILQTIASPDLPISNISSISSTRRQLIAAAGSRYAASAPLAAISECIAEHRRSGQRYAFIGKPCDAAALRELKERDSATATAFPVVLSFFCAGVPSHTGGLALLEALGVSIHETEAFRFRGNGWPGRAVARLKDGSERSVSYHESWGRILSKHIQHRCKICADGTGAAADIVCADAWESDAAGYPVFEEAPGVSLILARTPLGEEIISAAKVAGAIETTPFKVDALEAMQPGQRERRRALFARLAALWFAGYPIPRYRGLQILTAAKQNPFSRNLRNFLGMIRRVVQRRL